MELEFRSFLEWLLWSRPSPSCAVCLVMALLLALRVLMVGFKAKSKNDGVRASLRWPEHHTRTHGLPLLDVCSRFQ